jgi:uncharacterized protein YecT (DUF1311 family)
MKMLCVFLSLIALGTSTAVTQGDEKKCCCATYDTSVCLSKIREKVDAELNTTYREAESMTKRLGGQDVENLKDAEQKWVAYRDAACKAEHSLWGGGSGGPNALSMCGIKLTRQRTADLKRTYIKMNR